MLRWTLLLALGLACSPPSADDTGADGADAGDGVEPGPLQPLRVASFNANWLWATPGSGEVRRNATDYEMVGRLLTDNGLELVGLQEIDGAVALNQLRLEGDWEWITGRSGWNQRVAIAWRDDLLQVSNVYEVQLPSFEGSNKQPLFGEVRSRTGDLSFLFVVVHHKPYNDPDSAQERFDQAAELHAWLRDTAPSVVSEPIFAENIVLLGDFNDTFAGINPDWPSLDVFTSDPGWDFATAYTSHYTQISYQSQIDHIALSAPLMDSWVDARSDAGVEVIPHEQLEPWSNYPGGYNDPEPTISDHRPVWLRMEHGGPAR